MTIFNVFYLWFDFMQIFHNDVLLSAVKHEGHELMSSHRKCFQKIEATADAMLRNVLKLCYRSALVQRSLVLNRGAAAQ